MAVLANAKHEAVAQAFLADQQKIGWKAYRKVYPKSSKRAAITAFGRLLLKADFAARIAELKGEAAQGAVMTANEVLLGLSNLARANMQDYMRVGPSGEPVLDFGALTRDQAAALQEVTVEEFTDGHGDDARPVRKVKFKLADKRAALNDLGRHHGLFKDKVEHTGKDGGPLLVKEDISPLEAARRIAFAIELAAREAAKKDKR